MNTRLAVLLSIMLDAVGIGLIYPILPGLLRELTGSAEISMLYGVTVALYSLMQFVFSPVLGAASDRFGRRPVLLTSIAGATIDYLFMAFSPVMWMLLAGRAIAGLTSANIAVATAYIADITEEHERAKHMGYMNAAFGVGFIIGPVLGGLLGGIGLRLPFIVAAALNAVNFALTAGILPESRAAGGVVSFESLNPVGRMRWAAGLQPLLPLLAIFLIIGVVGNLPATVWVLYGQDRFHWNGTTIGLSLSMFGLCHAGAQALLTGPLTARWGERKTVIVGIVCDALSMLLFGLATRGWAAFALAPLFAMGGIGMPALQSMMTNTVEQDKQGELQGVLASIMSLTSIVGPLLAAAVYAATKASWIGAVWVMGAALYVFTVPLLRTARLARSAGLP